MQVDSAAKKYKRETGTSVLHVCLGDIQVTLRLRNHTGSDMLQCVFQRFCSMEYMYIVHQLI